MERSEIRAFAAAEGPRMRLFIAQGFGPQAGAAVQYASQLPDCAPLHPGDGAWAARPRNSHRFLSPFLTPLPLRAHAQTISPRQEGVFRRHTEGRRREPLLRVGL